MGGQGSGRRSAPANLRLLGGRAPGRDSGGRPVDQPPPFERADPVRPTWLTGYARIVWELTLPALVRLKLVKPEDMAALAAYCEAVAEFRAALADVRSNGMILEVVKEGVVWCGPESLDDVERAAAPYGLFKPWPVVERKANPAVAIKNAAAARIRTFAHEFGLTPAAEGALAALDKARNGGGAGDDVNPFAGTG